MCRFRFSSKFSINSGVRDLAFLTKVVALRAGLLMTSSEVPVVRKAITHIILDLDGTLLDTDKLVDDAYKVILKNYGKEWDGRGVAKRVGRWPLAGVQAFIEDYEIPVASEKIYSQMTDLLEGRWASAKPRPGALRLIQYLKSHGIPVAVASSSSSAITKVKCAHQPGLKEFLSVVVSGDEVKEGKPSPEIFLEAARRLKAKPSNCLVFEGSETGLIAAKAAGMEVIVVPSRPTKVLGTFYSPSDHVLSSLLDLQPEMWGLPPFGDWIADALPIEPWYLRGPVIRGFGRGSKVLGIPTANLPTAAFASILAEQVCGIYLGWAGLSDKGVYKMVMSVGYNPYFDNTEKTVEPWLLHEFPEDFYGEELRLIVVGYIRPEANFPSLEDLIERIHKDGAVANRALDLSPYSNYGELSYLTTPSQTTSLQDD